MAGGTKRLSATGIRAPASRKRRCPVTGKHRFRDHLEVVSALHSASNARQAFNDAGIEGLLRRRERRGYECSFCNAWHLTSREEATHMTLSPAGPFQAYSGIKRRT